MSGNDTHADTIRRLVAHSDPGLVALGALVADLGRERARAADANKTIARIWEQVAPGASYEDLDGRSIYDFVDELVRERARADQLTKALVQHHAIHNLSDAAVRESIGRTCQICARAALSAGSGGRETT